MNDHVLMMWVCKCCIGMKRVMNDHGVNDVGVSVLYWDEAADE